MVFIKQLFLILALLFSFNFYATDNSVIEAECRETLLNLMDEEKMMEASKKIRSEDYYEQLFKIKETYQHCLNINLQQDISINILIAVFGEPVYQTVELTNYLAKLINVSSVLEDENSEFQHNTSMFSKLIINLNELILWISTFIVSVVSFGFVYQGMKATEQKKSKKDLGLFIVKASFGLSLIVPMQVFGGYSAIQALFLAVIVLGILFAKILVTVMTFSFLNVNQDYDIEEALKNNYVYETVVAETKNNSLMHLCDITSREKFLAPEAFSIDNRLSILKQYDYYQCLTSNNSYADTSEFIFTPKQVLTGKRCAVEYGFIKEEDSYCGELVFSNQLKRTTADKLKITSIEFQNKLRQIALQMLEIQCKEDPDGAFDYVNTVNCMKQDIDGNYQADSKDQLLRINTGFKDSNERNEYVSKIIEEGQSYFRTNLENNIKTVFKDLVMINQAETIEKDLDEALNFIQKGWMAAGLVFYINGSATEDMEEELELLTNTYYTTFDYKILDNIVKETEYRKAQKLSILTMDGLFRATDKKIDNLGLVDAGKMIFGETYIGGDCQYDLSQCTTVSINPFYEVVHNGQKMIKDSIKINTVFNIAKMVVEYTTSNKSLSKFLDIPNTAISIYMIVGFILSMVVPAIPWLIFTWLVYGYLKRIFTSMVSIQILGIYFAMPEKSGDFVGAEKVIYQLFLEMFLYPAFLVIALCIAFILSSYSIALLNLSMSIMYSGLNLSGDITSVMGIVDLVTGVVIYTFLLCAMIVASSMSIKYLPEEMNRYLGLNVKTEDVMSNVKETISNNASKFVNPLLPKF